MRHTNAHRGLTALVFVELDQTRDFFHISALEPIGNQCLNAFVVFHIALNDGIQHLISRQAVLVFLVRAQLGARGTGDDAFGYGLAAGAIRVVEVAPAGQIKHPRFDHIFDHRKAARHIAIQGAITGGHLALVARRQHNGTRLIGQRHQQRAANAGLNVFFGGVFCQAFKLGRQGLFETLKQGGNRNFVVTHTQALDHVTRIDPADVRGVGRRHHHRVDVVGPDGIHRNRQHQRRIDAAGQPQNRAFKAVLAQIVAHTQHQRVPQFSVGCGQRHQSMGLGGQIKAFVVSR